MEPSVIKGIEKVGGAGGAWDEGGLGVAALLFKECECRGGRGGGVRRGRWGRRWEERTRNVLDAAAVQPTAICTSTRLDPTHPPHQLTHPPLPPCCNLPPSTREQEVKKEIDGAIEAAKAAAVPAPEELWASIYKGE